MQHMTNQDKFSYRWMRTCEQMHVGYEAAERWRLKLIESYSEPHRSYHTIDHIVQMFDHLDKNIPDDEASPLLDVAVFFHDSVYITWSDYNEEYSANYAHEFMRDVGCSVSVAELVSCLIMATKTHEKPNSETIGRALFHGIIESDLPILAAPMNDFVKYEDGISKEVAYLGRAKYLYNRIAFLMGLLERGYIYQSYWGNMFLDKKARDNIEWLVGKLDDERSLLES